MKSNVSTTILVISLLLLAACLFIVRSIRSNRLKKQETIEAARTSFLQHNKNLSVDSTYIHNDTLLFYSRGTFVGRTIVVRE